MSEDLHLYVVDELNRVGKEGWQTVADATGVSVHTLIKIARRSIDSPRYRILKPLVEYFREHPAEVSQ